MLLPTSMEAGYIHDLDPGTRDPYRDPYQVRNYKKKQRNRAGADDTKEVDIVLGVLSDALNVINPDLDKIADRIVSCFDKGNCNVGNLIEEFGDSVRIIHGNDISAEDILLFSEGENINKQSLTGFSRTGSLAAIVGRILEADKCATRINKENFQVNIDGPISSLFGPNEITINNEKSKFSIYYESTRVYLPCDPKILNWFVNWFVKPFFKQQLLFVNDNNDKYYNRNMHLDRQGQKAMTDEEKESFRAALATERSIGLDLVVRLCVLLLVSPVLLFFSILGILESSVYKIQQTFCKSKQSKFDEQCDERCEEILSITKQIPQNRIEKKVDSLLPESLICDEEEDSEYSKLRLYLKTFPKESIKGLDALKQYMHFLDDFLPEIKKSYFDSEGNFKSEAEKVWLYSRATKHMCKRFKHSEGLVFNFLRGLVQVLVLPIRLAQVIYKASMNTKCAKRKFFESVPFWGKHKTRRGMKMSTDLKKKMGLSNKNFTRRPGAKAQIEELINNPDKIEDYDHQRASDLFKRLNIPSNLTAYFSSMDEQYKKEYYIFDMIDKLIPETRPGDAQVNRRGEPRGGIGSLGHVGKRGQ